MESDQSKSGLACVLRRFEVVCAVLVFMFLTSCDRDYEAGKRSSATFQTQPYAVPVPPAGYAPTYQRPYQQYNPYYYGAPNSRSYYNPYDFQQPYGYNPYSDYDQYYVPPVQYYNNEYDSGNSAGSFSGKN